MKSMNVEFVADPQKKGEFFKHSFRGGQLCHGQNCERRASNLAASLCWQLSRISVRSKRKFDVIAARFVDSTNTLYFCFVLFTGDHSSNLANALDQSGLFTRSV